MQLAYQHPEVCERLVLVDSGGLGREVSPLLRAATLPGRRVRAARRVPVVRPGPGGRREPVPARPGHPLGPGRGDVAGLPVARPSRENRQAFVRTLRAVIDPGGQSVSAMDRLYLAAAVPTLIVWGDRTTRSSRSSHAHAAHEAIEGSRLEIIEGVGHFPHVEAPERFVDGAPRLPRDHPGRPTRRRHLPRPPGGARRRLLSGRQSVISPATPAGPRGDTGSSPPSGVSGSSARAGRGRRRVVVSPQRS